MNTLLCDQVMTTVTWCRILQC